MCDSVPAQQGADVPKGPLVQLLSFAKFFVALRPVPPICLSVPVHTELGEGDLSSQKPSSRSSPAWYTT